MSDIMIADELIKLKGLLDAGVLTQEEFESQKKKLLGTETKTNNEQEPESIQTRCRINGYLVVDLTEALDALNDRPENLATVVVSRTGLPRSDVEGLITFIRREQRIPLSYRTGYTYEMTKKMDDTGTDRLSFAQTMAGLNKSNYVTCPTCGKQAGEKISVVSRGVSVGLFGLASNKIGKSFKCKNCGYTW